MTTYTDNEMAELLRSYRPPDVVILPPPQSIPSTDHQRFNAWYEEWRGVFGCEIQALAMWKDAQPDTHRQHE